MRKPYSLRAYLVAALDARHGLSKDPARLMMTVTNAKILATGRPGAGFDYEYTLELVMLDFAGEPEEITVPLMQWVERWEHLLIASPEKARQGIDMTATLLNNGKVDVLIDLKLTESVRFAPRPDQPGHYDTVYVEEPMPMALQESQTQLHAVYLNGAVIARCAAHPDQG